MNVNMQFCRTELVRIKKRALRRGIWYRILSRTERILMDLTMRVVDVVRGFRLANLLNSIITKLCDAMESNVKRLMSTEGKERARRISEIGKKIGCKSAKNWVSDRGFMLFLVIAYINNPRVFNTLP